MVLALDKLSFGYGNARIIDSVSLEFPSGQLIGIIGPNGCGKSTLLQLLSRLLKPSEGQVQLYQRCLGRYSRRALAQQIGFLPQHPYCPRGLTVAQVLQYGRHPHQSLLRQFSEADQRVIHEVKEQLELRPMMDRPMEELSGGQRQKAWLGMVLTQDTSVVLLDEPTSALDIGHQTEVLECIREVANRGKTVVMVIHDLSSAARYCDQILALHRGKMAAFGPPQKVLTRELITQLYSTQVQILQSADHPSPIIVPLRPVSR